MFPQVAILTIEGLRMLGVVVIIIALGIFFSWRKGKIKNNRDLS